MNKVIYGSYTFSDADLTLLAGGSASTFWAPLGDELRAAEFSIPVQFCPRSWRTAAEDFKAGAVFGDPVDIYEDSTLLMRFYLTDITGGQRQQDGSYLFNLIGTDFVGLFTSSQHLGGVYSNTSAGSLIADILGAVKATEGTDKTTYQTAGGITYAVDAAIAGMRIDNWLPAVTDARANLREVLQIVGAAVQMAVDGSPLIAAMDHGTQIDVSGHEVYSGDTYVQEDPVTAVQVIEYGFVQVDGTPAEVIYDATDNAAVNALVTFDRPYYDIQGDADLTVHESGANYARITGTGILTGKPYTKLQRALVASTGLVGADNLKTIDNPLCSAAYSSGLLLRMVNYFATINKVQNAIAMPQHYTVGQLLGYPDPMNEDQQGYPIEQHLLFSGITKATGLLTADWQPTDETPFTESRLLTSAQTWTVPEGATRLRFVLIGGGKGGWGGYDGQPGSGHWFDPQPGYDGGNGGDPGEGGEGGKVLQVDVDYNDIEGSYAISIGAAGAPGAASHGEGTEGGDTTVTIGGTVRSSAEGVRYPYGVLDILTGLRYAQNGQRGIYAGGWGAGLNWDGPARDGGSVTDTETAVSGDPTTWSPGASIWTQAGEDFNIGGGGAAYGQNGSDARLSIGTSANGGAGAAASLDGFNGYTAPIPTIPGTGGLGGNGGGGGGCGGVYGHPTFGTMFGDGGAAGTGSPAGPAAPGAVLVLIAYGEPPTPINDRLLFDADGEALYDYNYERLKEAKQ